ncbi:MAG TPA: hypothetical protein VKS20_13010 [Candidatus Acidoferrales bacterium]|nr:hypothetical protein [Candidatus Acidoferrales bacterium]
MRKFTLFGVVFLVIAGLAYASSQVWMAKPYQQWNENDVREILFRSPWVKQSTILASWGKSPQAPADSSAPSAPSPEGMPPGRPGSMGSPGQGGQQPPSNGQQPGMDQQAPAAGARDVTYIIRWNSAQTVRDALARQAVLSGRASQAQVEQYVDQQPAMYQIFVGGMDMTPFATESNDSLKGKASLEVKPAKRKVAPTAVEILKSQDGKQIQGILFSFARQGPDGKPLITPNDKQAHFECKTKLANLSTNFDLRKMVGKKGQEL